MSDTAPTPASGQERADPPRTPAVAAASALGLAVTVTRHGPVRSLAEAAAARGVRPHDLIKTLVVRKGPDDYVFVLVPGDATFS